MLFALAAAAVTMTVVGPSQWNVTQVSGSPTTMQEVTVMLRNNSGGRIFWNLDHMPAWASCPIVPDHPEFGSHLTGSLGPSETRPVVFQFTGIPRDWKQSRYVDDISFSVFGSRAKEVGVDCYLNITPAP